MGRIIFGFVCSLTLFAVLGCSVQVGSAAPEDTTRKHLNSLMLEIKFQGVEDGSYPTTLDLVREADQTEMIDGWGNRIRYEITDADQRRFTLTSAGPDGVFDTADDMWANDKLETSYQ